MKVVASDSAREGGGAGCAGRPFRGASLPRINPAGDHTVTKSLGELVRTCLVYPPRVKARLIEVGEATRPIVR